MRKKLLYMMSFLFCFSLHGFFEQLQGSWKGKKIALRACSQGRRRRDNSRDSGNMAIKSFFAVFG